MKTLKDIDISNKKVVLRADYNVPLDNGKITDDYRVTQGLPTLEYLLSRGCRVVIISHLGRPEGGFDQRYSLQPVQERLQELINRPVALAKDLDQAGVTSEKITLLENIRFWSEEESGDEDFARQLAGLGEVLVQDCFGVAHRRHASIVGITKHIPGVAGLLLEKEVTTITEAMDKPERPLVAVVGGAKVSDKIELIERLIDRADGIIVGGAMANTFLKYNGYDIGKSMFEAGQEDIITKIYQKIAETKSDGDFLYLPTSSVFTAKSVDKSAKSRQVDTDKVAPEEYILDNSPTKEALSAIRSAGTVIWNGPTGVIELPEFTTGSRLIAQAIIESDAKSIIGGGDTAEFVHHEGLAESFDWVSTGGGAALDLMSGKQLPGVEAVE